MTRAMYERAYGEKAQHGWRKAADIAKLIRADIKAAIAAGDLPGTPGNYSVRSRSYSGGQAIDVVAKGLPGMWRRRSQAGACCPAWYRRTAEGWTAMSCGNVWCKAGGQNADSPHAQYHQVLTVEGQRVDELLNKIHFAYNWDGSESQVDYFDRLYWGHAEIDRPREEMAA